MIILYLANDNLLSKDLYLINLLINRSVSIISMNYENAVSKKLVFVMVLCVCIWFSLLKKR